MAWGANVVVVETGAVPRDGEDAAGDWRGFTLREAVALLHRCGFTVDGAEAGK